MTQAPHERLTASWGARIRAARTRQNLSQTQLANLVGQTQTTVSRYERGDAPFTPEAMVGFAVALDATVTDLFPWPIGIEDMERFRRLTAAKPAAAA